MNINQFRAEVETSGFQRPANFRVILAPPKILQSQTLTAISIMSSDSRVSRAAGGVDMMRALAFRCHAARLPGTRLMTSEVNRYGMGMYEDRPYGVRHDLPVLTVMLDRDNVLYDYFHAWLNCVFNHSPGVLDSISRPRQTVQYKDEYVTDVYVERLSETGESKGYTKLTRAFPLFVNEVEYSWAAKNRVLSIQVGLSFFSFDNGLRMSPGIAVTEVDPLLPSSPIPPQTADIPPKSTS